MTELKPTSAFACLLVDNGSLKPAATRSLRRIAAALEARTGVPVRPVSLLHSDKIPPSELDGVPAETLEPVLRRGGETGVESFVIIPLFFGPSAALTDYIPRRVEVLRREHPALSVRITHPLVRLDEPQDTRIARILAKNVRSTAAELPGGQPSAVVLVDHGSPQPTVGQVRDHVARQLAAELGGKVPAVIAASMERRPGPEYAFNEPLLEDALAQPPCGPGSGHVIISMMFVSAGRHAGEGGDVAEICARAEAACAGLFTHRTPLVGSDPLLIDVLADRLREATRG